MKTYRNPENIHAPLAAYTHQIEVSAQSRWLVLSGQVGKDLKGNIPEDSILQIELALENIVENLKAADMEVKDLVKLVFYLVGDTDNIRRRDAISKVLKGHMPCMTVLYVVGLASPSLKVEIDAWACEDT